MVLGLLLRLSPPKENLTKSLCGEVVRAWRCEPYRSFNTYKIDCLLSVLSVYVWCVCTSVCQCTCPCLYTEDIRFYNFPPCSLRQDLPLIPLVSLAAGKPQQSKRKHWAYKCVCYHAWLCAWVLGLCTQVLVLAQPFSHWAFFLALYFPFKS